MAASDRPFFYSDFQPSRTQIMARASQKTKAETSTQSGALRYRRIVVKAGTGALTGPSGLDSEVMADLVRQVCQAREPSGEVVLVASGGIANYTAGDTGKTQGLRSDLIEQTLGYHYGQEVVYRNNLVLL